MSFFDPVSFLIGTGVGTALGAGGVYALKERLFGMDAKPADADKHSVGNINIPQAGSRYDVEMLTFFQTRHMAGQQFALSDILVEPRFLRERPAKLRLEEDEDGVLIETDLYRVIPFLHQFPSIYAPFNMETVRLLDLETGNRHIAILGQAGMGKSTALAVLGLIALGAIDPKEHFRTDQENEFLDNLDDDDLTDDERDRRRKEYEEVQRRAIEKLRIVQNREDEEAELDELDESVDFTQLLPIYVHLHDIDLSPETYGGTIDPAEPLVNALQNYVSRTGFITSPPLIYRELADGQALVLIDGWDELLPEERWRYNEWMMAFLEHYGRNFVVTTAPPTGFDPLIQMGFAPIAIRPFTPQHNDDLIRNWVQMWEAEDGNELPDDNVMQGLLTDNRNRSVLDMTLKIWAILADDVREIGRRGWYEHAIRQQLGNETLEDSIAVLQTAAAYWLENGAEPSAEIMTRIAREHLGLEIDEDEFDDADDEAKKKKPKKAKKQRGASEDESLLTALAETRLVHSRPDGAFGFMHPIFGWYLAAETLQGLAPGEIETFGLKDNWHGALGFATAFLDLEPAVLQKMRQQHDLIYTNMLSVVDWMPDAQNGLRWTGEILKRLGAAMMLQNQFPTVREHAAAALVTARDKSGGVIYLFRQAVRSGNPDLRRLGCLGLGAIGSEEAVKDLGSMLFDDVEEVALAAGLALGSIGTEDALNPMVEALLTADGSLRKAVAESLAAIPGEGHAILHDGITHEDIEVRRACAFGLARIPSTWALVALYRAMLEDSQWYVRQAAERAFTFAREPRSAGPRLYPEPAAYVWLEEWAARRGEAVPEGVGGRQVLMNALQEASAELKIESARALGRLAHLGAMKALYATLSDDVPEVRIAAYEALSRISHRIGRTIPAIQ